MSEQTQEGFRYSDGSQPQDRPFVAERGSESHLEPGPAEKVPAEPEEFSYYVHLADGRVERVKDYPTHAHHFDSERDEASGGNKIIGIYPR